MRIVTRDELMAMPPGTIYSTWEPRVCDGLYRKGDTILGDGGKPIDWFEASLIADHGHDDDEHPTLTDDITREGFFDDAQRYAVYEPADVQLMGRMLGILPPA